METQLTWQTVTQISDETKSTLRPRGYCVPNAPRWRELRGVWASIARWFPKLHAAKKIRAGADRHQPVSARGRARPGHGRISD